MTSDKPKSLMRNLGEFFGHIAHGVKADPARPATQKPAARKQEVRREVEEREETAPDGRKVTVRRTTIEEVEILDPDRPDKQARGVNP
jgi:hypothetical protein